MATEPIKRYTVEGPDEHGCYRVMDTMPCGEFVLWSDVQKLLALREAEAAEVEAWRRYDKAACSCGDENGEDCRKCDVLFFAVQMANNATNAARREAGVEQ